MSRARPPARTVVIGAAGSGTTTLGRALAAQLGGLHVETDDVLWLPTPPFVTKRAIPERERLLDSLLAASSRWVISGSLCGWGDFVIPLLSRVVFLTVPAPVRLARLRARERRRYGAEALEPGSARAAASAEFLDWAARYDTDRTSERNRAMHEEWLARIEVPVQRLENDRSVDDALREILAWTPQTASDTARRGPRSRG